MSILPTTRANTANESGIGIEPQILGHGTVLGLNHLHL